MVWHVLRKEDNDWVKEYIHTYITYIKFQVNNAKIALQSLYNQRSGKDKENK